MFHVKLNAGLGNRLFQYASIKGFANKLNMDINIIDIENTYHDINNSYRWFYDKIIEDLEQLGVEQDLVDALNLDPEYILKLAEYGVKTIEDLAEITIEEFRKIVPEDNISNKDIEELIYFAQSQNK